MRKRLVYYFRRGDFGNREIKEVNARHGSMYSRKGMIEIKEIYTLSSQVHSRPHILLLGFMKERKKKQWYAFLGTTLALISSDLLIIMARSYIQSSLHNCNKNQGENKNEKTKENRNKKGFLVQYKIYGKYSSYSLLYLEEYKLTGRSLDDDTLHQLISSLPILDQYNREFSKYIEKKVK